MKYAKILCLFLVATLLIVAVAPAPAAITSQGDYWAGSNGNHGSIASHAELVRAGYTPFHGPSTFEDCHAVLHAHGLLRSDGHPW